MRKNRKELSTHLLNGTHEDVTSVEVATFFELVGALTHEKVLVEHLVWEAFGNWVTNYYWALRNPVDLIGRTRKELADPLVFHEFEWLHDRMVQIDRRELGGKHAAVLEKEEESRTILGSEAELDIS
jgi:hypothetical protein